jgi:hypothetical protein
VQEDATKAEDFIDRLSTVYRYSLDHRHKELTALESELTALQSLMYLYNDKFSGAISGHVTVSEAEQQLLIIPGSLLDIMEDIILSTIITLQHPLSVDIFVENGFVALHYTCNDTLLPRQAAAETIARLTQTYSFFTDKAIVYNKTATECIIKVPLLTAVPESPVSVQGIFSRIDQQMYPQQAT